MSKMIITRASAARLQRGMKVVYPDGSTGTITRTNVRWWWPFSRTRIIKIKQERP